MLCAGPRINGWRARRRVGCLGGLFAITCAAVLAFFLCFC